MKDQNLILLEEKNPLMAFRLKQQMGLEIESIASEFQTTSSRELIFIKNLVSLINLSSDELKEIEALQSIVIVVEEASKTTHDILEKDLSRWISSKSIHWYLEEQMTDELLIHLGWRFPFKKVRTTFQFPWFEKFKELSLSIDLIFSEYRDFGIKSFQNLYQNRWVYQKSSSLMTIKGSKSALICGAGPSLKDSISWLKEIQNSCTLIAVGHAIEILDEYDIKIDVAAAVDPKYHLKKRLKNCPHFLFSTRVEPKMLLQDWKTFTLIPPSGESLVEQEVWKRVFGQETIFDGGWNVATCVAAYIQKEKFERVILVGMDMCYSNQEKYPLKYDDEKEDLIEIIDRDGKVKTTIAPFLLGRNFLQELIKTSCFKWYSVGEGLCMESVSNLFSSNLYFEKENPSLIFDEIKDSRAADEFFDEFKNSCIHSELYLKKIVQIGRQELYALEEVLLEEEIFYHLVLKRNWEVWGQYFSHHTQGQDPLLMKYVFFHDVSLKYKEVFLSTGDQ